MIFVTVGTELPFDRMIRVVDEWAKKHGRDDVFAQIGEGAKEPEHIQFARFLQPEDFTRRFSEADVIIAHAGMGSILSALHYQKPIIVFPRKASLGEQRNEHQLATARRMLDMGKINVAFEEEELLKQLNNLDALAPKQMIGEFASEGLLEGLSQFLEA